MPPESDEAVGATLRRLVRSFSAEITPRETAKLPPLGEVLGAGTAVYLTNLARVPWERTVEAARWVADAGMRPVPHLAARYVPDRAALQRMLAPLTALGVTDLLLVAGSTDPAGEFHEVAQIIASGCLEEAGIERIGVAGHPEGHPDVADDVLDAALLTKAALAREHGLAAHVVTQFGFAAEPVVAWERRIRAAGVDLPVHVGLPGLTSPMKLLKFGLSCGVGPSLSVLRHQTGGVFKLATSPVHHPDALLLGLAEAVTADPASLIENVHFFPFGALVPTAAWAWEIREGRFAMHDRARLSVPA
ncbi:methylenetetrahydrofolate reductase [Pseudonocardia sp. CA-107938]|uniref:methylenetetrahydrofolate reductase n=1 Tax=Pseudonocardia sp. CA-107938 TaxID=3240021 RepID=UPI003D8D3342